MADSKITALTAISTVDPTADPLVIVDVSDTSMAASGTTKKSTINQLLGAGGTATLASATITGDLTVRTNKLLVTATGVGVGAAPVNSFDVTSTSGTLSVFKRTGSNGAFIGIEDGSGAGLAYLGFTNGTFSIQTPGSGYSDKLSIDTSGNVLMGVASANANGGVLQLKSGITFPATQVAASDANTLDDYEEGTFTPTVIGATTAGVGVYATQGGRYTKIGNLVTVQVYLGWGAHTGTGNMRFGNFPFTTSSESASNNGVAFGYVHNIALSASNVLTGFTSPGNSYVDAYQYPVGGGASTAVPIDTAGDVIFTASYRV